MPSIFTILVPQFNTSFFRAKCSRINASLDMHMHVNTDCEILNNKKKQVSLQLSSLTLPPISKAENATFCNFSYFKHPSGEEFGPHGNDSFQFGKFVVRKAILDEELRMSAQIRAECQWEDRSNTPVVEFTLDQVLGTADSHCVLSRYTDYHKRKYADQEYDSMINRTRKPTVESSSCIVTVRKELNNEALPVTSVVATLDLDIKYLLQGETFPGERVNPPQFCAVNRSSSSKYGYVANLVVAKSARYQGIASNMLHFAIKYAKSRGVSRVYLHVKRENELARIMYQSLGFQLVEMENPMLIEQQLYLMRLQV